MEGWEMNAVDLVRFSPRQHSWVKRWLPRHPGVALSSLRVGGLYKSSLFVPKTCVLYVVILVPFMPWWILYCLYTSCLVPRLTEQWVARFIFHAFEAYMKVFRTWEFCWDAVCCTKCRFQGKMSWAGSKLYDCGCHIPNSRFCFLPCVIFL